MPGFDGAADFETVFRSIPLSLDSMSSRRRMIFLAFESIMNIPIESDTNMRIPQIGSTNGLMFMVCSLLLAVNYTTLQDAFLAALVIWMCRAEITFLICISVKSSQPSARWSFIARVSAAI